MKYTYANSYIIHEERITDSDIPSDNATFAYHSIIHFAFLINFRLCSDNVFIPKIISGIEL